VFIADNLENHGIHVTLSPWTNDQLYVASDSPKSILSSMPFSHQTAMIKLTHVPEEEWAAVCAPQSWLGLSQTQKIQRFNCVCLG
jgi:hypothetical protein